MCFWGVSELVSIVSISYHFPLCDYWHGKVWLQRPVIPIHQRACASSCEMLWYVVNRWLFLGKTGKSKRVPGCLVSKFAQPYLIPRYFYRPVSILRAAAVDYHVSNLASIHMFLVLSSAIAGLWDDLRWHIRGRSWNANGNAREGHNIFMTSYSVSWRQ